MSEPVTYEVLRGFLDAFNRHDLDAIMDYFAEEGVFYMPRGSAPRGDRYVGKKKVRAGLANDLMASQMFITEKIIIGCAVISGSPNGF